MNKILLKSSYLVVAALLFFISVFSLLIGANKLASAETPAVAFTSADVSAVWINRVEIEVTINGQVYTFRDEGGLNDDQDYKFQIQGSECFGEIKGFDSGFLTQDKASKELEFDIDYLPPDGECIDFDEGEFKKTVASPEKAMSSFAWVSREKIQAVDGDASWIFTDDPDTDEFIFVRDTESSCKDKIIVEENRQWAVFYELDSDGRDTAPPEAKAGGCKLFVDIRDGSNSPEENNPPSLTRFLLANPDQSDSDEEIFIAGGGGFSSSSPSCESNGGGLSWILCPILRWSSEALEVVEGWITNRLEIPSGYYDNTGVQDAWSRIRNIAYIILIPVLLIMVISTALGYSFVDAYTARRALPRLLVAIIFMALSYQLCVLMIEIVNDIGRGIAGLIAAPFGGSDELTLQAIFNPSGGQTVVFVLGGGIVLAGLGVAAISVVSVGVLASYLFVAALAMLAIFFLLVFRQMILIALIILSPFAIISWVFPGNDKLWKLWWNTFSKLLLLYPIIVAALVTGRAFASIVPSAETSGIDSILTILIQLTAYIAPFFLIPAIFRYAGGAFANLAGIVNNRSKGLFDRNRKFRSDKMKQNLQDTQNRNRFKNAPQDSLRGRTNRFLQGATNVNKAGINPMNMRSNMRTAMSDQSDSAIDEFSKSAAFRPISGDDAKLWAARHENREDIANELATRDADRFAGTANARAREDAVNQIIRAQKATGRDTFQRARIRSQATTGTGYQNAQGEFDSSLMLQDINSTYGNDRNGAAGAIAQMRGALTQSGQIAGQAGFSTWAGQAENMYRAQTSGATFAERQQIAQTAHDSIMDNAIDSAPPQYALHGKPSSARAFGAAHMRRIQSIAQAVQTGEASREDLDAALAGAAGIYDAMSQANPQNASAFAEELMGAQITGSAELQIPLTRQEITSRDDQGNVTGTRNVLDTSRMINGRDLTVRELISNRDMSGPEDYINRRRGTSRQMLEGDNLRPSPPQQNPLRPQ